MRLLLGRCRLGLARTLGLTDRTAEADAERAAAEELLRAARAGTWLTHADRTRPDHGRRAAA